MSVLRGRVLALYVGLCAVWGSTWLAIKIGLQDLPPLWFAGIRMVLASALLMPFALATSGARAKKVDGVGRLPADRPPIRLHLHGRAVDRLGPGGAALLDLPDLRGRLRALPAAGRAPDGPHPRLGGPGPLGSRGDRGAVGNLDVLDRDAAAAARKRDDAAGLGRCSSRQRAQQEVPLGR